jgi:hypothetical protein
VASERIVRCAKCRTVLPEPPNTKTPGTTCNGSNSRTAVDGAVADNPQEPILAVSEKLLPPSQPVE